MQLVRYTNALGELIDFDISSKFILQRIEGTGNVEANHLTSTIPFQNGSQRNMTNLGNRYMKLNGTLLAESRKELAHLKEILCDVFNPSLDDGKLEYDSGNGTKYINTIPEETPMFSEYKGNSIQFIVNLVCHDPYWHDLYWTEENFTTPYTSTFQFPHSFKTATFQMGYQTESRVFNNIGSVATPLIIEFEGGIKNVKLINKTNGEWIEFKKKLESNETLYINSSTGKKEIKIINAKGDKRNGLGLLTIDCSSYMSLSKGENTIDFIGDSDLSTGKVKIKWLTNYLGV